MSMTAGDAPDDVTSVALEAVAQASGPGGGRRLVPRRRRNGRGPQQRRLRRVATTLGGTARGGIRLTAARLAGGGRWLTGQVLAMAPRLPVRDAQTLRHQFPGLSHDELASALIEGATKASGAVGAALGAWAVLPFPPAAAAEIAVETLAVVGIEVKLVAELHEVYGMRAPGGLADRMTAYVAAWSARRGVSLAPGGLVLAAGSPLGRQLQRRLARRAGRSVFALAPLLTGAVAGAALNRRETRKLGTAVSADLRRRSPLAATAAVTAAPGAAGPADQG
jgi:hypothetical protein